MKITKEKIFGTIGSIIFCGLLIVILYCTYLFTKIEMQEQGVLVNFGTVDWASGTFEPAPEGNTQSQVSTVTNQPESTERVPVANVETPPAITQNTEPTVSVEDLEKKKREEQQRAEQARINAEKQRQDAINQQMSGAFGVGDTPQGSEGTAESGTGNQGSSQGNAPTGSYVGVGGYGGFSLTGRTLGAGGLPRPAYSVQEEGRIVIDITVDSKGNVISAEIGRGTNITNNTMRTSALEAARKAKFNTIAGNNNQSGSITYNYKLN